MKVLAITNLYPTAANPWLGNFVEQQVKGLQEIGQDVDVLSLDRAELGPQIYIRMGEEVRQRFKQKKYDLVHVMYGGVMADLSTRMLSDVPSIVTIHGSDLLGDRLSDPIRRFSAYLGIFASRRAIRRADGVIVVSAQLRDALPNTVSRSKVRIIPCGIDLHRFSPQDPEACRRKLGWNPDSYHILFATSGSSIKRPGLARQAVRHLQELGTKAEMHEMRGLPYDQVPIWINASHALILTSLHEGSPTIVKECLACNVPVVSVDVGDVRERTQGIAGCFVVPAKEEELAISLQAACKARPQVNSRDHIQDLSITSIAEKISRFYNEVISARNRPQL